MFCYEKKQNRFREFLGLGGVVKKEVLSLHQNTGSSQLLAVTKSILHKIM